MNGIKTHHTVYQTVEVMALQYGQLYAYRIVGQRGKKETLAKYRRAEDAMSAGLAHVDKLVGALTAK